MSVSEFPCVALMGPTATGKTALALKMAQHWPVEIISVDSALIYKQMDIGTAKPEAAELAQVPHHLIDIRDPAQSFSAWEFAEAARGLIQAIQQRGRLPLLVGGTMLYFRALLEGLNALPQANEAIRQQLEHEAEQQGWSALHQKLAGLDPAAAVRIQPGDRQRIQRALEVHMLTGRSLTELLQQQTPKLDSPVLKVVLAPQDRGPLHQRIATRFERMLQLGLIEEVEGLRARGDLNLALPSMRCVGYRQVWLMLDGTISADEMPDKAIAATRQLAKRQFTWLKKQPADFSNYADTPDWPALKAWLEAALHKHFEG